MLLSELMQGLTPDPAFEGFLTADNMVIAVDVTGTATDPNQFVVAQYGITDQSGALTPQTQSSTYLRTGEVTIKTGTSRGFAITGDRYVGDAFQDFVLSHEVKYGTGQDVIRSYVYFDMLTGKGEMGKVSIAVGDDLTGAAGENASFSADLTSTVKPEVYNYAPIAP